ncbi:MAG: SagB/ThcOx family dehydrogenase [Candidatus Bathyarchaeota archaeon]|nr:MAG: SagB/ThcOx family dehydrogenase [Candidatus Bathyarchaeota archaeon]
MPRGIGMEFMEKTQIRYLGDSDQGKGLPQPPLELGYDETKPIINLPLPKDIKVKTIDLVKVIENRRSVRNYSEQSLTLDELSFLLWCTQGVKEVLDASATLRTVPSAGARHAFETYLLVNRVQGIHSGLYRFLAVKHKLAEISLDSSLADRLVEACLNQRFVGTSAVTFIWVAVPYRMVWRYGERGYRYLHIDVGHVCQNLYLAAEGIDSGVCAIAAFSDDAINDVIGADGKQQFVVCIATVGKKQKA